MAFLSRFFAKRSEWSFAQAEEAFATSLRLLQVDLFADLSNIYSGQMDSNVADSLAAGVVNFLKGEDIDEIARISDSPMRSGMMAVLPHVKQRAAEYMQADRQTREIIVATLRMKTVLEFGKYGEAYLESPAKIRVEKLLVEYGPEFPEEIKPEAYVRMFSKYHAIKREAWAARQILS